MIEWTEDSEREAEEQRFFGPWAEAMVKAEVSRGQLEEIWDRIKVKLDDLGKVEQLIADVFGHRARMVDEDSFNHRSREK